MIPKQGGRDIGDPVARAASRSYDVMPLPALLSLLQLRRVVRRELGRVTQPVLVLHGRLDHTAPPTNVALLRRRLGSRWIETHILERSWHVLTEDVERDEVGRLAVDFLSRVEVELRPGQERSAARAALLDGRRGGGALHREVQRRVLRREPHQVVHQDAGRHAIEPRRRRPAEVDRDVAAAELLDQQVEHHRDAAVDAAALDGEAVVVRSRASRASPGAARRR